MSSSQPDRQSYIRAVHEVMPSEALEKFLRRVVKIGLDELGYKDTTLVRKPTNRDHQLAADAVAYEGVGIEAVRAYPTNSLRVTVFERRAPRNQRDNQALRRLFGRLAELELPQSSRASGKPLGARPQYIIDSTNDTHSQAIREFALVLERGSTEALFLAEHEALQREADRRPQSKLNRSIYGSNVMPSIVPILTLPASSDAERVLSFIDRVNDEVLPDSALQLEFEPLEWNSKIRLQQS